MKKGFCIEAAIGDGMFILNSSTRNLPNTYSALARRVTVKVLNFINIHEDLYFYIYKNPSIKDVKRKDCGETEAEREFCIRPRLKILINFNELLRISNFKSSFLNFFDYENPEYPLYANILNILNM